LFFKNFSIVFIFVLLLFQRVDSLNARTFSLPQAPSQWPFRKTGTMGTLAIQAEIGIWVQAPGGALCGIPGYHPRKIFETEYAKSCNSAFLAGNWLAIPSIMRSFTL